MIASCPYLSGDFIAGLKILEKEPITSTLVSQYVAQMQPSAEALAPHLLWNPDRYARNLFIATISWKCLPSAGSLAHTAA